MSLLYPHGKAEADDYAAVQRSAAGQEHGSFTAEVVALCDHLAIFIAGTSALTLGRLTQGGSMPVEIATLTISLLVFTIAARLFRAHAAGRLGLLLPQVARSGAALALSLAVTAALVRAVAAPVDLTVPVVGAWFGLSVWLFLSWRCLVLWFAGKPGFAPLMRRRTVVVGSPAFVRELNAHFASRPDGFQVVGSFDASGGIDRDSETPFIGGIGNLRPWCVRNRVRTVLVERPVDSGEMARVLGLIDGLAADVRLLERTDLPVRPDASVGRFGGWLALQVRDRPIRDWNELGKRVLDIAGSGVLILALLPLFALISALIAIESPGGVFFRQRRFGYQNEEISVLKFRSMYVDRQDVSGARRTTRDDPRVTRVGRFLRRTSLDEIPQLFNVFMGSMSLVGPRPHAIAMKVGDQLYHEALPHYVQRHRVKPGITGLAQISGFRGEVDGMDHARGRLDHDLRYIETWSLALDVKILLKTAGCVFGDRNAY